MQITIRLFANFSEVFGAPSILVTLPKTATVGDLRDAVGARYPEAAHLLAQSFIAVDEAYADDADPLTPDAEVALIPPVGGGEVDTDMRCRVAHDPLDVAAATAWLEDRYCGGTVVFLGTVREWTRGRQTVHLTYEAYETMALRQMRTIADEVETQFPNVRTLQWHRVGLLYPTDVAVICAAASPHRANAFAATNLLIERLKKEVAIWKKEQYVDGEAVWQPNEQL